MQRTIYFSRILFVALMLVFKANVSAQTYTVQTSLSTSPPYYNYLSHFADQNNHLQVILTLLDFNTPPINVRLRVRIEGPGYELYTNPNFVVGQPFELVSGMPLFLTDLDLQPYLQESNLIISPSGVDINNLPEGYTTICVDVILDGTNQEVISSNNCTSFQLQRYLPSVPFLPNCESVLDTNQMFYSFQWTDPMGYIPDVNTTLEHTFSLYRWNDPNNFTIFQSDQGLVWRETVNFPMVQISDFDIAFEKGGLYVWRVESQIYSNGMPVHMIENDGISIPCTFHFGEPQSLVDILTDGLYIDLNTEPTSDRKGKAYWTVIDNTPNEGLSTFDKYLVEYRRQPTGNESYSIPWFSDTLIDTLDFIYQLEPSTTYEVKVSGIVGGIIGDPTAVETFTTPDPRVYACGEGDLPYFPFTWSPLENAQAGIQVQVGQFVMNTTQIQSVGSLGHYSGKGTVSIPFLMGAKAKVTFDDILIDTEYLVREGRVDVVTQGLEGWLHDQYGQFVDPIYVSGVIDSAYVDSSGVAWAVVDGVSIPFTFDPPDYPIILNDENGNQYTIYPNDSIQVTSYVTVSENWDVDPDEVALFAQNDNENRGFDPKQHMQWHENYEIMRLSDSSLYFVANKSMAEGESDAVNVELPQGTQASFQLADGTPISSGSVQGSWIGQSTYPSGVKHTLTIPSFQSSGNYEVHVFANNQKIGQLNVVVYSEKQKEVIVVPLVANLSVSEAQIKTKLDETLGEANINVTVTLAPQWNDTTFTETTVVGLPNETGLLTKYSDEQRALRDAYFDANPSASSDAFYLFVVHSFDDPNEVGYMVHGRGMGFIKATQSDVLNTIAHELGHGIGALEHTWKHNGPEQETTTNLMDYGTVAGNLIREQWRELRDLDFMPSLFDNVEDFMFGFDNAIPFYQDQQVWESMTPAQSKMGFVFLNGERYKFRPQDNITEVMFDKFGRVYGFKTAIETYKAFITQGSVSGDYHCYYYVNETDHNTYQNSVAVAGSTLQTTEQEYLQANKYQFVDCPINTQCFRMSVIYRHSGIPSSPNLWISDDCYVEDIFLNPSSTPVSGYSGGIYLGPSFVTNNFTVIDGTNDDCWFPPYVTNLNETGAGAIIYYELSQDISQQSVAIEALVDLANYFSDISANEVRVFYDYQTNDYTYFGVNNESAGSPLYYNEPSLIPEVFERDSIYSTQDFYNAFPRNEWFFDRRHDSIISAQNIRSTIPEWYNAHTIDYTTYDIPSFKDWSVFDYQELGEVIDYIEDLYNDVVAANPSYASNQNMQNTVLWIAEARSNLPLTLTYRLDLRHNIIAILNTLGAFDRYEYSILDLVARESLVQNGGGVFLTAIQSKEQDGMANPINGSESNTQYMNRFDTDCAFYLGFEYMKMYVDNFFEPVALLNVIQKAQAIRNVFKSHKTSYQKNLDDIFRGTNNTIDDLAGAWKNGWTKEQVLAMSPRPTPSTYLKQSYIDNHLTKFDDGAVRFTTDNYSTLGTNEAFVMPKSEFDKLMSTTAGDLTAIENALTLNPGTLTGSNTVIAWVKKSDFNALRFPSGNESGAISGLWQPGGLTGGGYSEAILDLSNPNLTYTLFPF